MNYPEGTNLNHPTLAGDAEPTEKGYAVYCELVDTWIAHPEHCDDELNSAADAIESAKGISAWASADMGEDEASAVVYLILEHEDGAVDKYQLEPVQTVKFDAVKFKYKLEE